MFSTELRYAVVRYMHSELTDEAANVGLIAVTDDPLRVFLQFLDDPSAKSRLDVKVRREAVDRFRDIALGVIEQCKHAAQDKNQPLSSVLFPALSDHSAGLVRMSTVRAVLTNDVEAEVNGLYSEWVAPKTRENRRSPTQRDPLGGMRKEAASAIARTFRETLGRSLPKKQFARFHEIRGAHHRTKFDLLVLTGAGKSRREHIFHHLLILPGPEESFDQAAALCWRWQDVTNANHTKRHLTAVLYGRGEDRKKGIGEATKLLDQQEISHTRLTELPGVVEKLEPQLPLLSR